MILFIRVAVKIERALRFVAWLLVGNMVIGRNDADIVEVLDDGTMVSRTMLFVPNGVAVKITDYYGAVIIALDVNVLVYIILFDIGATSPNAQQIEVIINSDRNKMAQAKNGPIILLQLYIVFRKYTQPFVWVFAAPNVIREKAAERNWIFRGVFTFLYDVNICVEFLYIGELFSKFPTTIPTNNFHEQKSSLVGGEAKPAKVR